MKVTPLTQLHTAAKAEAEVRKQKASRKHAASVLVATVAKRESVIASIEAAANKVNAAFTDKSKKFSRAALKNLAATLAKMDKAAALHAQTAMAHTRVALAHAMPTSKLVAHYEGLTALRAKLAMLQAVAESTLDDGAGSDETLLQVDENGYLVDTADDVTAPAVPEPTDPQAAPTANKADVTDSNGEPVLPATASKQKADVTDSNGEPVPAADAPAPAPTEVMPTQIAADDNGDALFEGLGDDIVVPDDQSTAKKAEITDSNGQPPAVPAINPVAPATAADDTVPVADDVVTDPVVDPAVDPATDPATAAADDDSLDALVQNDTLTDEDPACTAVDADGDDLVTDLDDLNDPNGLNLELPDAGIDNIVSAEVLTDPSLEIQEPGDAAPQGSAAARATARSAVRRTAARTGATPVTSQASAVDPVASMMNELIL